MNLISNILGCRPSRIMTIGVLTFMVLAPGSVVLAQGVVSDGGQELVQPKAGIFEKKYKSEDTDKTEDKDGMTADLRAILISIFGGISSGSTFNSSGSNSSAYGGECFGSSEMACSDDYGDSGGYSPDTYENFRTDSASELGSPFKILAPIKKYFDTCTNKAGIGSCRFVNLGVTGDSAHQKRRSCHNSAQAIDVGPLTCSGGRKVMPSSPEYFEVAKCMANDTNNELQVIFYKTEGKNMIKKSDHNNHMHIQLKNCAMIYG